MDKNVSGVDLEELKLAREQLDKEQGKVSDPNMYNDYNPNREEVSLENSENDNSLNDSYENISNNHNELNSKPEDKNESNEEKEVSYFSDTNGASEQNLSKFAAFSAFDVSDSKNSNSTLEEQNPVKLINEKEDELEEDKKFESISNIDEFDALLDELLSQEDDELDENLITEAKNQNNTIPQNSEQKHSAVTEINIEPSFDNLSGNLSIDLQEEKVANSEEKLQNFGDDNVPNGTVNINEENTSLNIGGGETNETILNVNELNDYVEKEKAKEQVNQEDSSEFIYQKPIKAENSSSETEIITDFSKLKEILQNELKESEDAEEEKIIETKKSSFNKIDDFKFINEISKDEFKQADPFSYIMGKNELGEMVYGNFKHHFNLAVFGKNEQVTNSFLNSMMLSLCLKNNCNIINFVLLDSNINSSFEVYNKSSYLYFNRIAKTNKEILDTLIEVTKELENRYQKFASIGVKNIEAFNDVSVSQPLPYIILVFNNYTSASQATNSDKINSCLYQILKFGRICGIYAVVTASNVIETSQINYNLSSRLSFKSGGDSRYTVGMEDGDLLPDENDALYFNIANSSVEHIKTVTVSDMELDLIIKDLEE